MMLIGKTLEQIEHAVRNKSREELIQLIYEHATLEPHFSVTQVARARGVSRDVILDKIATREFLRVHKPIDNAYRIPLSTVRAWDEATATKLNGAT